MIVIFGFLAVIILAAVLAAPLAFFTMLFLGNIGVHLSFWSVLPGAIALRIATTSLVAPKTNK